MVKKKKPACRFWLDVRDTGSIPQSGRSPEGGHSNPLQYSCLENLMDSGAWRATVHRVAKSWTQQKQLSIHTHTHTHTRGEVWPLPSATRRGSLGPWNGMCESSAFLCWGKGTSLVVQWLLRFQRKRFRFHPWLEK